MLDIEPGTYSWTEGDREVVFIIDENPISFGKVLMMGDKTLMLFAFREFNFGPITFTIPMSKEKFESIFEFYRDVLERKEDLLG